MEPFRIGCAQSCPANCRIEDNLRIRRILEDLFLTVLQNPSEGIRLEIATGKGESETEALAKELEVQKIFAASAKRGTTRESAARLCVPRIYVGTQTSQANSERARFDSPRFLSAGTVCPWHASTQRACDRGAVVVCDVFPCSNSSRQHRPGCAQHPHQLRFGCMRSCQKMKRTILSGKRPRRFQRSWVLVPITLAMKA